jgi:hypothetical protein
MSLALRAADLIRSRSTRTVTTLRRANTILPGRSPQTLKLSAALSAGATSLSAVSPSTSQVLDGKVVKGAVFTIAGVTGSYTVAADAQVPVGAASTLTLFFTPPIPIGQSAAIGTVLTFTTPHKDYTYPIPRRGGQAEDSKGFASGRRMRTLPFDPSKPAPEVGNFLDGILITQVDTSDVDGEVAFYRVYTGAAP